MNWHPGGDDGGPPWRPTPAPFWSWLLGAALLAAWLAKATEAVVERW